MRLKRSDEYGIEKLQLAETAIGGIISWIEEGKGHDPQSAAEIQQACDLVLGVVEPMRYHYAFKTKQGSTW